MDTRRLYVTWRSPTGSILPVGLLEQRSQSPRYRFAYLKSVESIDGFPPFPGLPELHRGYESDVLFPVFQNRVMSQEREDYPRFVQQLDLSVDDEPFVVLGRSGGARQTDRIEVFPEPLPVGGVLDCPFFVRGIRHMPGASDVVADLGIGAHLELVLDEENEHDSRARLLVWAGDQAIGWLPGYLVSVVDELQLLVGDPRVVVARVNPPSAPSHLRVLCRLQSAWPEGWRPFAGSEYSPLVPVD
ncbi:hypothetical protein [Actinomarinicola tropica]|uniref:HIRAN domain-containing protein n=1 Tax=Actinomarinicola tropica TaxID=2789776 RepID=A0A5Q2RBW6_9ACTN|nr:hypothetical protein [Actinomarinicola tropica]QGG94369.1 hypothetical protein GH723_04205 [Actinomarinicola tropica]